MKRQILTASLIFAAGLVFTGQSHAASPEDIWRAKSGRYYPAKSYGIGHSAQKTARRGVADPRPFNRIAAERRRILEQHRRATEAPLDRIMKERRRIVELYGR